MHYFIFTKLATGSIRVKPCHVGIHWIALTEFSQMGTHVAGFQSFSGFLHHSWLAMQISQQQHKG